MEKWHHHHRQTIREDRWCRKASENQSFSSTLLDAIYRSIDEGEAPNREGMAVYRSETATKKKHYHHPQQQQQQRSCSAATVRGNAALEEAEMANLRRAIMIEKWMEKKVTEKVVVCRNPAPAPPSSGYEKSSRRRDSPEFPLTHSSSSSSDSSCGGGFSSSEAESVQGASNFLEGPPKPKPVRTSAAASEKPRRELHSLCDLEKTGRNCGSEKGEGGSGSFGKTKSRALKIYGDLKKVKQPISPGAKLAGFLNSLFNAAAQNAKKKPKMSQSSEKSLRRSNGCGGGGGCDDKSSERTFKSAHASTCSSASSFSRSCLSKTPSSTAANLGNGGGKRSVRFFPESVILDEESRPCGHKKLYGDHLDHLNRPSSVAVASAKNSKISRNSIEEELNFRVREANRRVEEAARDLLLRKKFEAEEEEDLDCDGLDDGASCSSSDLFELDHLSVVGMGSIGGSGYGEELPVYETTHLGTNRAIANGFLL